MKTENRKGIEFTALALAAVFAITLAACSNPVGGGGGGGGSNSGNSSGGGDTSGTGGTPIVGNTEPKKLTITGLGAYSAGDVHVQVFFGTVPYVGVAGNYSSASTIDAAGSITMSLEMFNSAGVLTDWKGSGSYNIAIHSANDQVPLHHVYTAGNELAALGYASEADVAKLRKYNFDKADNIIDLSQFRQHPAINIGTGNAKSIKITGLDALDGDKGFVELWMGNIPYMPYPVSQHVTIAGGTVTLPVVIRDPNNWNTILDNWKGDGSYYIRFYHYGGGSSAVFVYTNGSTFEQLGYRNYVLNFAKLPKYTFNSTDTEIEFSFTQFRKDQF